MVKLWCLFSTVHWTTVLHGIFNFLHQNFLSFDAKQTSYSRLLQFCLVKTAVCCWLTRALALSHTSNVSQNQTFQLKEAKKAAWKCTVCDNSPFPITWGQSIHRKYDWKLLELERSPPRPPLSWPVPPLFRIKMAPLLWGCFNARSCSVTVVDFRW